jgi:hypothetical protein
MYVYIHIHEYCLNKKATQGWACWIMPIIPATHEAAEIKIE